MADILLSTLYLVIPLISNSGVNDNSIDLSIILMKLLSTTLLTDTKETEL